MSEIIIGKVGGEDWVGTNDGGVGRLLFKLKESESIFDDHERLREENQRLTAIATKHATRADELYEVLEDICSYLSEDGLITNGLSSEIIKAKKVLEKSRIEAEQDNG